MALDPKIIKESFEVAKPLADEVVAKFYEFLWTDYPESKALFEKVSMEDQKKALIGSLVFIVDHLEETEKVVKYLEDMGARHVNYGVETAHYGWVGSTLLKTFAHFFGEKWTPELKAQWTEAYTIISTTMQNGAAQVAKKAS